MVIGLPKMDEKTWLAYTVILIFFNLTLVFVGAVNKQTLGIAVGPLA